MAKNRSMAIKHTLAKKYAAQESHENDVRDIMISRLYGIDSRIAFSMYHKINYSAKRGKVVM